MKKDLKISALLGLLLCLPVSGFVYGFIKCSDWGIGVSSVLGRVFIGAAHIFLNIITLGKLYDNEGGISSTNIYTNNPNDIWLEVIRGQKNKSLYNIQKNRKP